MFTKDGLGFQYLNLKYTNFSLTHKFSLKLIPHLYRGNLIKTKINLSMLRFVESETKFAKFPTVNKVADYRRLEVYLIRTNITTLILVSYNDV